jgi:hypothetical protein
MEIYRYVLTSDTGMAPCIDQGTVTLATCKPVIRRCAQAGDWTIGCHSAPAEPGLVAWAGRVQRGLAIGDYERQFRGRADAVYQERPDGTFARLRPDYHNDADQIRKDLSGPALIFDPMSTWYFGDKPVLLPDALMHLAPRGEGHRVNGVLARDSEKLTVWLASFGPPGLFGKPPHEEASSFCGPCGSRQTPPRGCG